MNKNNTIEHIDIGSDSVINEIVEKCYIAGKNLCIN